MFLLKKTLSDLMLPPAGPLLLAALGLLLLQRWPRTGKTLAWSGLLLLWLLATPALTRPFGDPADALPPLAPAAARGADAIVVLGAGNYHAAPEYGGDTVSASGLERLRYGARLARQAKLPILLTGGAPRGGLPEAQAMREALQRDFGLQARWVEDRSSDTRENARFSAPLLREAGVKRVLLVTHAAHMVRALAEFEQAGIEAVAAPTAYPTQPPLSLPDFLPQPQGLAQSRALLHEWLGRLAQHVL